MRACRVCARPTHARRTALLLIAGSQLVLTAGQASAQRLLSLPEYAPLNPAMAARSSLSTFAYRAPAEGWRGAFAMEYGSAIELDTQGDASYLLDAELLRVRLTVTRDVASDGFVFFEGGVATSHNGFADGFFDSFHNLIRHRHRARDSRPRNGFAYAIQLGDISADYPTAAPGLTDLRAGIGLRLHARAQAVLAVTLPTATTPAGYRRGVPSLALITTVRAQPLLRVGYEGSVGLGVTPRHGALSAWQRQAALSASSGIRIRAVREHSLYGLIFYHSPVHDHIPLPELAGGELTTEFGAIIVRGGREWRVGIVEDIRLTDGGIDLILKLSTSL